MWEHKTHAGFLFCQHRSSPVNSRAAGLEWSWDGLIWPTGPLASPGPGGEAQLNLDRWVTRCRNGKTDAAASSANYRGAGPGGGLLRRGNGRNDRGVSLTRFHEHGREGSRPYGVNWSLVACCESLPRVIPHPITSTRAAAAIVRQPIISRAGGRATTAGARLGRWGPHLRSPVAARHRRPRSACRWQRTCLRSRARDTAAAFM